MPELEGPSARCQFCLEFAGWSEAVYPELAEGWPADRTIHRADGFRVIPPLGQFVEGAVMVLAERHVACVAAMGADEAVSFSRFLDRCIDRVERAYGPCVVFEHGPPAAGTKGTCCVDHAHVHVFPVEMDVVGRLERLRFKPLASILDLRELPIGPGGYLYVRQGGRDFGASCETIPSQLVRQDIAVHLGVPERWHWRSYLGLQELRRTWETLRAADWAGP